MTPKDITGTFTDEQYDKKDTTSKWDIRFYDDSYNYLHGYIFGSDSSRTIQSGIIDAEHDYYLVISSYDADEAGPGK